MQYVITEIDYMSSNIGVTNVVYAVLELFRESLDMMSSNLDIHLTGITDDNSKKFNALLFRVHHK